MGNLRQDQCKVSAAARKKVADLRTPEEQIARLDNAFGKGLGAVKERAKLAAKMKRLK
jgi:hypothetical protein